MGEWKELTRESQARWEANTEYWDDYMGEHDNRFHRVIIRPKTEELLAVAEGQTILDIGCGNGNFSRRLADFIAKVVAVDYSPKMIERAKLRSRGYGDRIEYRVADVTQYEELIRLGVGRFDGAVANMALMDMADVSALPRALGELLKAGGAFVFSILHPCFQPPGLRKIHETEEAAARS